MILIEHALSMDYIDFYLQPTFCGGFLTLNYVGKEGRDGGKDCMASPLDIHNTIYEETRAAGIGIT